MKAVWKHELKMYYSSITAYVFGAFLLMFTGLGALYYNIQSSVANFEYVLSFISIIFVIIIPILTMKVISEERKQKTDQLLYSLPITTTDVVLGKFFALACVYALPLVVMCFYPLLFSRFGDVYLPTSYGSIIAFFFMGLALITIGMFISSLTESQGLAAGICVAVMLFNYYSSSLADYVSSTSLGSLIGIIILILLLGLLIRYLTKSSILGYSTAGILLIASVVLYLVDSEKLEGLLPSLFEKISLFDRFTVFVNGVFDMTAIVYYISVCAFFLFLCVQSLEKRRYN